MWNRCILHKLLVFIIGNMNHSRSHDDDSRCNFIILNKIGLRFNALKKIVYIYINININDLNTSK